VTGGGRAGSVITVLVCDDDPLIRSALRDVLAAEPGLDVVAVASGPVEAADLALRHLPAVAVLDMRMPDGGGPRTAREVAQCSPRTAILAFSAYSDAASVQEMTRAGAAEFLAKGARNTEIVAAVRRLGTPEQEVRDGGGGFA
jgi:DNA-binding NarL/FixJ family response regulator